MLFFQTVKFYHCIGDQQAQTHIGVVEIQTQQFFDAAHPINNIISVHMKQLTCFGGSSLAFQVGAQKPEIIGIVLTIVFPQGMQCLGVDAVLPDGKAFFIFSQEIINQVVIIDKDALPPSEVLCLSRQLRFP